MGGLIYAVRVSQCFNKALCVNRIRSLSLRSWDNNVVVDTYVGVPVCIGVCSILWPYASRKYKQVHCVSCLAEIL